MPRRLYLLLVFLMLYDTFAVLCERWSRHLIHNVKTSFFRVAGELRSSNEDSLPSSPF